jgi:hypothetical protein
MIRPLAAFAGLVAAGATAGGVVYVALPGGGEEEAVQQVATATPGASATSSSAATLAVTPSPQPSTTAAPAPVATPVPVPEGWVTYEDPGGLFAIAYPPGWFERNGHFYSKDPDTVVETKNGVPAEIVKVDIGYYPDDGVSGCGLLTVDPTTGGLQPSTADAPTIVATTTVDGAPAWHFIRSKGDPVLDLGVTRIEGIDLVYKGYCFNIRAYYTQANPDVDTIAKVIASFQFKM